MRVRGTHSHAPRARCGATRRVAAFCLAGAAAVAVALATAAPGVPAFAAATPGWTAGPTFDPAASAAHPVTGLSCTRSGFCLAVDSGGRTFVWTGSWHGAPAISRAAGFVDGLSCVSSSFCVAISSTGSMAAATSYAVTWTGAGWSAPRKLYGGVGGAAEYATVRGIACTSATFCIAVGGQVGSIVFDGGGWSTRPGSTSGTDGQATVGCASPRFCVDFHDGNANYWNGSAWRWTAANSTLSSGAVAGLNSFVYGLSCVSATFCVAAELAGTPLVWNGRGWRFAHESPSDPGGFASVSCTSAGFCAAGGDNGRLASWNGSSWTVTRAPRLPVAQVLVSCTAPERCLALSSDGPSAELGPKP